MFQRIVSSELLETKEQPVRNLNFYEQDDIVATKVRRLVRMFLSQYTGCPSLFSLKLLCATDVHVGIRKDHSGCYNLCSYPKIALPVRCTLNHSNDVTAVSFGPNKGFAKSSCVLHVNVVAESLGRHVHLEEKK